jgi:hypothetical protein
LQWTQDLLFDSGEVRAGSLKDEARPAVTSCCGWADDPVRPSIFSQYLAEMDQLSSA